MGSCQNQKQKQNEITYENLQGMNKSNSKNSLKTNEDESNEDFLLFQDELYQEISIIPHYQNQYDLKNNLTFEIKSLFQQVQASDKQQQKIPAIIELSTNGIPLQQFRGGVDLVCVIDVNKSMKGEKIKLVKQTLLKLLEQLEEKDRLSLIVFNDQTQVLTALKKMTLKNKQHFQKVIRDITASGGTNICNALEKALFQLKQRQQMNSVASIFLLSDGWDYQAKEKVDEIFYGNVVSFTLNTIGFGQDHDTQLLTKISTLYQGVYYNVTDIYQLEKHFLQALRHVITSDGQQIEITIGCLANEIFEDQIKISKLYSKKWRQIVNEKKYQILLPLIDQASIKSFILELQIPILKKIMIGKQKDIATLCATIHMKCPITNQIILKTAYLNLTIFNSTIPCQKFQQNSEISFKYYKAKCIEKICQAKELCQSNKFEYAKIVLNKVLTKINSDDAIVAQCSDIILELTQAITIVDYAQQDYNNGYKTQQISNNYTQEEFLAKIYEIERKRQEKALQIRSNNMRTEQNNIS